MATKFTDKDIALLRRTLCAGFLDAEVDLFVMACERLGLDPFARQIVPVARWDAKAQANRMTIMTTIDGFRLVAERSGRYEGQTVPLWCGDDGVWRDVWLDSKKPPYAAKVGIHRAGAREPIYAVARYDSYLQTAKTGKGDTRPNATWGKMPDIMLSKCAEALALRKAFPAELSGLYAAEEMAQAEQELASIDGDSQEKPPTAAPEPRHAPEPEPPAAQPIPEPDDTMAKFARLEGMIADLLRVPASDLDALQAAWDRLNNKLAGSVAKAVKLDVVPRERRDDLQNAVKRASKHLLGAMEAIEKPGAAA